MSTPSDVAGKSLAAADGSASSLNQSLKGPVSRKSGNRRERPLVGRSATFAPDLERYFRS
jgi:hypothetical protein